MKTLLTAAIALFAYAALAQPGMARERRHNPVFRSHASIHVVRTSHCEHADCFSRHPSGTWRHPIHERWRR